MIKQYPRGDLLDLYQASMGASQWYQFLYPPGTACLLSPHDAQDYLHQRKNLILILNSSQSAVAILLPFYGIMWQEDDFMATINVIFNNIIRSLHQNRTIKKQYYVRLQCLDLQAQMKKISPWICIKCLACDIFLTSKKDDFQFLLLQNDMHFWRFDVK